MKKRGYVPAYKYRITLHDSDYTIGAIDIRIGYNKNLYYGGHIGYRIEKIIGEIIMLQKLVKLSKM